MKKFKVVLTDNAFSTIDIEKVMLDEIDAELIVANSDEEDDIIIVASNADALLVGYACITEKVIRMLQKCKIISRYGIGVDNINLEAATHQGIKVTNVPDYCIEEVSSHTLAFILGLARKIAALNCSVKKGIWSYNDHKPIYRLQGKTIGLIGFGRIARNLVKKLKPFGFRIIAYDPYISFEDMEKYNIETAPLEDLLQQSDFVSLHIPLTKETKHMISEKELKMMKSTAYIINTSRGFLVDEEALYIALRDQWISGAALDVLENEKGIYVSSPLMELDNIIFTPHVAFYSEESIVELRLKAVNEVINALIGKSLHYCVN